MSTLTNPSVYAPAGVSVLLVDGSSTCLTIISKMLGRCGYSVLTASRAADAFSTIRQKEDELDLILADGRLPDMDRYQLLETLREMSKLPVVLMSADNDEIAVLGGLFKGAVHYLVKPVKMGDLRNMWQFAFVWKQSSRLAARGFGCASPQKSVALGEGRKKQWLLYQEKADHYDTKRKQSEEIRRWNEEKSNDSSGILKRPKLTRTKEQPTTYFQVLGNGAQPRETVGHLSSATENVSSLSQKLYLSLDQAYQIQEPTLALFAPNNPSSDQAYLIQEPTLAHFAPKNPSFSFNLQQGLIQSPNWQSKMGAYGAESQGLVDESMKKYSYMPVIYLGSQYPLDLPEKMLWDGSPSVANPSIEGFPYVGDPKNYEYNNAEGLNLNIGGYGFGTTVQPKAVMSWPVPE